MQLKDEKEETPRPEPAPMQAIMPAPDHVQQPRPPSNLQDLLRFATEAQQGLPSDTHLHPLDPERREFLESALKSMTIDVIEVIKKQIECLKNVSDTMSEEELEEKQSAFDTILDYVDNIDFACDFHKLNGFSVIEPCLKSRYAEIRSEVCNLIAVLAQNNPYIQLQVLHHGYIPELVKLLDDTDNSVKVKACYALRAVVDQCPDMRVVDMFTNNNGVQKLLDAIKSDCQPLRIKAAHFLSNLTSMLPIMENGVKYNLPPVLVNLIENDPEDIYPAFPALLYSFLEKDKSGKAIEELKKYNLKEILEQHLKLVDGKADYEEQQFYYKHISNKVYNTNYTVADTL